MLILMHSLHKGIAVVECFRGFTSTSTITVSSFIAYCMLCSSLIIMFLNDKPEAKQDEYRFGSMGAGIN